jgi:hypothetical protein
MWFLCKMKVIHLFLLVLERQSESGQRVPLSSLSLFLITAVIACRVVVKALRRAF